MKCPFCAEVIKNEAKVCRYCGRDMPPPPDVRAAKQAKKFLMWFGIVAVVVVMFTVYVTNRYDDRVNACERARKLGSGMTNEQCLSFMSEHGREAFDAMWAMGRR